MLLFTRNYWNLVWKLYEVLKIFHAHFQLLTNVVLIPVQVKGQITIVWQRLAVLDVFAVRGGQEQIAQHVFAR